MSARRTCAVLPLKRFDDAKERLATGLDPFHRSAMARAMATDVIAAIPSCERIEDFVIVTTEPSVASIAGDGVSAILADGRSGHSNAAVVGIEWSIAAGYDSVLLIPGDCPLIDPREIDQLIERCERDEVAVAIIPDRMGSGTNGLLLTPPNAITPSFGPDSRERHLRIAAEAGRRAEVTEVSTLALDLDTAEDLMELAERISAGGHDAINTEQTIAALMFDRRRLPGGYAR